MPAIETWLPAMPANETWLPPVPAPRGGSQPYGTSGTARHLIN